MKSTRKNPADHMAESRQMVQIGSGASRNTEDIKLDKCAAYKTVAQINSRREIEKHDLHGVNDIGDALYDENRKMREMFIDKFDEAPENRLPGEDVKKIERRYTKQTKKFLEALEYEA